MIYAINKRTKEHRVVPLDDRIGSWMPEWETVGADADGWIPWNGGDCPLPDDARIKVMTRNGVEHRLPIHAGNQRWGHGGGQYDITAYRPILDAESSEPEAPEWDGEGLPPVGCECDCYHTGTYQGVVTVRYMGSEMCVLLNHDHGEEQCGPIDAYSFRPLRTSVQRAEDEAVEEMIRSAGLDDEEYNRGVCRDLYRAGYRKEA